MAKLTVFDLQQMKRDKKRIVAAMCHDYQMAQIAERAGADIITVGDSVGGRFFGQRTPFETTMDQMVAVCQGVTAGVQRSIVNCDLPFGPIQEGPAEAVRASIRLVREGHADMVKVDAAADNPDCVRAIAKAGIPVWAQFGFTPQTTAQYGGFDKITDEIRQSMRSQILEQAQMLVEAGASLFDVTNVGNEILAEIVRSVNVPVLAGLNGGPAADGRITVTYGLVGYSPAVIDKPVPGRANIGRTIYDALVKQFEAMRDGTAAP